MHIIHIYALNRCGSGPVPNGPTNVRSSPKLYIIPECGKQKALHWDANAQDQEQPILTGSQQKPHHNDSHGGIAGKH